MRERRATVVCEERGETVAAGRVECPVRAALRDRGHVGNRDREEVQHVRHGRAVEVAVGLHTAVVGDHGIVDGGGELSRRDQTGVLDGVTSRAMHLRRAPQ